MALGKGYDRQDCAFARALELLGERWTLLIVRDAFYGVRRYGDFLAHLDAPRAVLSQRLAALVEAGVLERRQYQDAPVRHEYALTSRGEELWPVIYTLGRWGERHLVTEPYRYFHHTTCGSRLDPAGSCPTCARWAPPAEIEVRPGPAADRSRTDPVSVALHEPHRLLARLL
jgi:DNA-binding HxlR family transcriptional regulator